MITAHVPRPDPTAKASERHLPADERRGMIRVALTTGAVEQTMPDRRDWMVAGLLVGSLILAAVAVALIVAGMISAPPLSSKLLGAGCVSALVGGAMALGVIMGLSYRRD
jgi:hypothetical protein